MCQCFAKNMFCICVLYINWWIIGGLVWELFSGLRILNSYQSSRLGVVLRFANFKLEPVVCLSIHQVWDMFNRGNYINECNIVLYWNLSKDATAFWLLNFLDTRDKYARKQIMYITSTQHWNGKIVRMTALVFTGDVEDKFQRLPWISELSTWRHFRFDECVKNTSFRITKRCKAPQISDDVMIWTHFPHYACHFGGIYR